MARLEFSDLSFKKGKNRIRVNFLKYYHFFVESKEVEQIGDYEVKQNAIEFEDLKKDRAMRKFNRLVDRGFQGLLSLNNRNTVYIHKNSGIPLIGSQYFGMIDRGTNIIELRPNTGCNLKCIFCSVDEGNSGNWITDYVVEKDYLVSEVKELIKIKQGDGYEIYINPMGEPLLYAQLAELVGDLTSIKQVDRVSINTNGSLVDEQMVDKLAANGLSKLIFSLNTFNPAIASDLAGCPYNVEKTLKVIDYAKNRLEVAIAPVFMLGYEQEIERLIQYSEDNSILIGIQNYLVYKHGRRPVKALSMDKFYSKLQQWEKKYGLKLTVDPEDLNVVQTKELPKPFKKREIISAEIACPGRLRNEVLAKAKDRLILIHGCSKNSGRIKATITRTKHNIFSGKI